MRILIMGLPGSGKTTLANALQAQEELVLTYRLNGDEVRKQFNDWDFSEEGRNNQAKRMNSLAVDVSQLYTYIIVDFVCPTETTRKIFDPNFIIWMNTVEKSKYDDTNSLFEIPTKVDIEINNFSYDILKIVAQIKSRSRYAKLF